MAKKVKKLAKKAGKAERKVTHRAATHRDTPMVKVAGFLAEAADQPQLIAASIATFGVGLATGRRDLARGGARMLASHLVATGLKTLLKQQVDRTRPEKALADGRHQLKKGDGADDTEMNSFPSGHTAGAVAVARAAAHDIKGIGAPAGLAAGAVAAIQPPAGKHYLSDVLVGGAIGWAAEALVSAVFDRVEPKVEEVIGARVG